MTRVHKTAAFVLLTCALGLSIVIAAQQTRVAAPVNAPGVATNVTSDALRRAGTATDALSGSWLSYGRTQGETRNGPLKQIDTTNAKRLGLAWSYVMGAGGGNQEGTPLMWNNTLYGITSWSAHAWDSRGIGGTGSCLENFKRAVSRHRFILSIE